MIADTVVTSVQDDLSRIVHAALASEPAQALSRMLEEIARAMQGYGCLLWERERTADFRSEPFKGNVFVLASWFPQDATKDICPVSELALNGSLTGIANCDGQTWISDDLNRDLRVVPQDSFLSLNRITQLIAVPLPWKEEAGVWAVLTVYALEERASFDHDDVARLKQLVANLRSLYKAVRDRLSFNLVQVVQDIVNGAQLQAPQGLLYEADHQQVMDDICRAVAKAFHSLEVSVFLESPKAPGVCNLVGTTWNEDFPKKAYRKLVSDGLTAWPLAYGRSVLISDLANHPRIEQDYPGIVWEDTLPFQELVSQRLPRRPNGLPWPMSFVAAPVLSASSAIGVIRCSTATDAPYYYSYDDVRLLELVASQISRCWISWMEQAAAADRIRHIQEELQRETKERIQAFETLYHQLGGPLVQAERHADSAAKGHPTHDLRAIRGLIRKAKRVTTTIGLVADASGTGNKQWQLEMLEYARLDRLLREAAEDQNALSDCDHPVEFKVDQRSYDISHLFRFRVHYDLIEQAVSNLLDNAAKYSDANTEVQIYGGLTGTGNFHISVRNKGIKLRQEHKTEVVKRGWRSDEAVWCTDKGHGIGLWVVDNIMTTHKGRLEVVPTDERGWTEFKLVFPRQA